MSRFPLNREKPIPLHKDANLERTTAALMPTTLTFLTVFSSLLCCLVCHHQFWHHSSILTVSFFKFQVQRGKAGNQLDALAVHACVATGALLIALVPFGLTTLSL